MSTSSKDFTAGVDKVVGVGFDSSADLHQLAVTSRWPCRRASHPESPLATLINYSVHGFDSLSSGEWPLATSTELNNDPLRDEENSR